MTPAAISRAAELICGSRLSDSVIGQLPVSCRPVNEVEAYLVQDTLHKRSAGSGLGAI